MMKTRSRPKESRARDRTAQTLKNGYVKSAAKLNPRGRRSRERLKEAARKVLNKKGYNNLRVQDITEGAGVANGLFYRYFHDLREIVTEITSDFFDRLMEASNTLDSGDDPYNLIYRNHCIVVDRFAQNPGILACLFGLAGDYEEFDALWKRNAHKWNLQVAGFLQVWVGMDRSHAEHLGFVLGAMTEGVIYQALIRHTEDLCKLGSEPEDIAETIAVMWYRAIFLKNPPVDSLGDSGRDLVGNTSTGQSSGGKAFRGQVAKKDP